MKNGLRCYRVWDLPTRLFHWILVILVAVSIYTGQNGGFREMDYHMLSGYAILALILFRIIWGFVGSKHARFADFVSPGAVMSYTRSLFSREEKKTTQSPGHNPLGALSIIVMLLVLLTQAVTGLFANDDIFLEGPLAHLAGDEVSDDLTSVHHINSKLLYVLIGLHLLAVVFYQFVRRESLLLPMITGKTGGAASEDVKPLKESATALVVMAVCAGIVYYLVNEF